jgi:hypothetical protein
VLPCVCAALLASGCGGGTKQNSGEHKRSYKMTLTGASFPAKQSIARPTSMKLAVHNEDSLTIPNLAVSIDSFDYTEKYPELAADKRPVWVVEQGPGASPARPVESQAISPPGGGQTAYVNTWALGPLKPGATRTFIWKVVPVKSGSHTVHLTIAAGLGGNAKAVLASGGPVAKTFTAEISPAPAVTHVNPDTGKVSAGAFPASP